MDVTLGFILIAVAVAAVIFFVLKKVVKVALFFALLIVVLMVMTGGNIMSDFSKLKQGVSSPSVVLLENEGTLITGFTDGPTIIPINDTIRQSYEVGNFSAIRGDSYKVYLFSPESLRDIEVNNKPVLAEELSSYFIEGTPISQITFEDLTLDRNVTTRDMQAALLAYAYRHDLAPSVSPLDFFQSYRKGDIRVFPETAFFRFMKIFPPSLFQGNLNKLKEAGTNTWHSWTE